jgi:thioredoxin 1
MKNFKNTINSNEKTLVKFGTAWCGPCKMLGRVLNQVKEKGLERVYEIDIEDNTDLKTEYSIKSVPTTIVFQNGEQIERFTGLSNVNKIINFMK